MDESICDDNYVLKALAKIKDTFITCRFKNNSSAAGPIGIYIVVDGICVDVIN